MNVPALAPFYRASALAKRWSTSKVTIWRMRARGVLPEPLRLSAGLVGWTDQQIAQVEARFATEAADREAARRAKAAPQNTTEQAARPRRRRRGDRG